jgi:hypothetical protein
MAAKKPAKAKARPKAKAKPRAMAGAKSTTRSRPKPKPKPKPKPEPAEELQTVNGLSEVLSVQRTTLARALHGETPDAINGRRRLWSLARVRSILETRSKAFANDGKEKTASAKKYELECRKIAAQCAQVEQRNLREAGALTRTAEFIEFFQAFVGDVDLMLARKLEMEYPKTVAGLEIAAIRVKGKHLRDEIRAQMRKALKKWKPQTKKGN